MKLPLALLLLSAVPLSAQTRSNQNIVVNVVVTLVKVGGPVSTPIPPPVTPISTPGDPTPVDPPTTPTPPTNPVAGGCVNNYPGAVKSMSTVTTALVQAEQLYQNAFAQNAISAATYASGTQTLALVSVDNADVRDLIRIAGTSDRIKKNLTFVSAEIGTLPAVLGATGQLGKSLTSLTTSMQTNLGTASTLVAQSTCPQSVPD